RFVQARGVRGGNGGHGAKETPAAGAPPPAPLRCLHLASFIESCQPRRTAAGTSRISCTARERAPSQSAAPNPRPPTPGIAIVRLLPTRHFSPRALALAAGLVLAPAAPPAAVVAGVTLLPAVASAQRAELEPIIR